MGPGIPCQDVLGDPLHIKDCLLPIWRVHGINRMHLASCTHGLFIT
jgi:hypothetical protein